MHPAMLMFALLFTFINVSNAETSQDVLSTGAECDTEREMESKSTVASSFVQTRRIEGKMIAIEKEESFLGADPQWFPNTHGDLQIEATNTTFFIDRCSAGTDPKKNLLEDARISHATCRSEQQTINGSNVSQNCYGEKKAACDAMQSIFEESYCNFAESREDYCKEFEACHAAADIAHASGKQKVEQQEQDLREMFIQQKKLECKIAAWPLTASSKSGCDSMTVDTSHLGVTHPTKPVPPACTYPVLPVPGVSEWEAAEYSSKSWVGLVEPVKSCATPVPSPAPTPVQVRPSGQAEVGIQFGGYLQLPMMNNVRSISFWARMTSFEKLGFAYLVDARPGLKSGYMANEQPGAGWNKIAIDGVMVKDIYYRPQRPGKILPENQWVHIYIEAAYSFNDDINFLSKNGGTTSIFYPTGYLAGISIWSTTKTETQIARLAHQLLPPNTEGLLAYFSFSEGSGHSVTSSLGSEEFIGTLHSSPTTHYQVGGSPTWH
jgi:hypothetical protein